jgi:hypothetical protein
MNLFRSEGHARNWSGFSATDGLLALGDMMAIFSTSPYTERLKEGYISARKRYYEERVEPIRSITHNNPFWDPAPRG